MTDETAEWSGRWRRGLLVASVAVAAIFALAAALGGIVLTTPPVPHADRLALVAIGGLGLSAIVWVARKAHKSRLALLLTIAGLCAVATESLGSRPRRAWTRDLRLPALELAQHVPTGAPVWTPGPADIAGKHASLYFYLERPVLAFRAGHAVPPAGSYCLLPADRLGEFGHSSPLEFDEIVRVGHRRGDFLLGSCSWIAERDVSR